MAPKQNGAVLFICLVILALLMILGTASITTGVIGLRVASNTSQSVEAVQKADAGVSAVMSLIDTADNPFKGASVADPFANFTSANHPLANVSDVSVATTLQVQDGTCSRSETASSDSKISCEYYTIDSVYSSVDMGATVIATQGVRREIIGN